MDAATGEVMQTISYDAFGRVLTNSNPDFQPFAYAGGLYDTQSGLVHFDVREYDASTGRWLSLEPLSFEGGDANLYRYALADPINNSDRSGTAPFDLKDKLQAMWVETRAVAIEAAEDAAARVALRAARSAMRRQMCDWAADMMSTYSDWQDFALKGDFQGHHPNRKEDMLLEVTGKPYSIYADFIVPILGDNTVGTPHHDAGVAQKYARDFLGFGMTAAGAYALHQAGCSAEAILKITTIFLENARERGWILNDDQPNPPQ